MTDSDPHTAIVVGAGCSVNLGVPTMPAFMDKMFDTLADKPDDLRKIRDFLQVVKASGAYVRTKMLNIEELYGLADMNYDLKFGGKKKKAKKVIASLNEGIYQIAINAGAEFVNKETISIPVTEDELRTIKRESATEDVHAWDQGSKYTNLLAYMCLASHEDKGGSRPLFIQFNWDLALDRAMWYYFQKKYQLKPSACAPWYRGPSQEIYNKYPRLARPHGGVNWIDCKRSGSRPPGNFICTLGGERAKTPSIVVDSLLIYKTSFPHPDWTEYDMGIVPPTWRKQATEPVFQQQWAHILQGLKTVRRIVFIGYSMPKTDLYFRHFLALALAHNDYSPEIYIWNPGIGSDRELKSNYMDFFLPLAQEGRVYGINGYFGSPALFDLERALREAEKFTPENGLS